MPSLRDRFAAGRGYLAACTLGLPADVTREARAPRPRALGDRHGRRVRVLGGPRARARPRRDAARRRARPDRHRIAGLGVRGARRGIGARPAPRWSASTATSPPSSARSSRAATCGCATCRSTTLADEVGADTWMVSYSLVQSATGEVADAASVAEAARDRRRARAASTPRRPPGGCRPTDLEADLIVCHAYKWLVRPARGGVRRRSRPRRSTRSRRSPRDGTRAPTRGRRATAPTLHLAEDASRFDVSPAWHAWAGAEAALGFAAVARHAEGVRAPRGRRSRTRSASGSASSAVRQRDRDLARRRRHRPRGAHAPRASPHRAAPGARASRSTSGTTTRTSTSPRTSLRGAERARSPATRADAALSAGSARSRAPGSTACRAPRP